ncbi:MAG: DUF5615 family PIN-like protein [Candidatus Rokubacteria bacterium]|nr:DUF5615 family PIN-like protein [Candidatus Rokubacteria bacterium]
MNLKLDENLGERGASLFRSEGHDVATVPGQGMSSARDHDLIAACQAERRCLVTLDLDFSNPLVFPPRDYSGIAVLRFPRKPTEEDLFEVYRKLCGERGEEFALAVVAQMKRTRLVPLSETIALEAADLSLRHSLSMADAFILATARHARCPLVTSDAHFRGLDGVTYIA